MTDKAVVRQRTRRAPAVLAAALATSGVLLGGGLWGSATGDTDAGSTSSRGLLDTRSNADGLATDPEGAARPPLLPDRGVSSGSGATVVHGDETVFDDTAPAVYNLDAELRDALQRAATDAARSGIDMALNSGWRSEEQQERLLREAVDRYRSREEAARWVATPETSAHVSGDAVDIGPPDAAAWLSRHGAEFGLCRTYDNEPWHYELRVTAVDGGCPSSYADPTHDPRLQ